MISIEEVSLFFQERDNCFSLSPFTTFCILLYLKFVRVRIYFHIFTGRLYIIILRPSETIFHSRTLGNTRQLLRMYGSFFWNSLVLIIFTSIYFNFPFYFLLEDEHLHFTKPIKLKAITAFEFSWNICGTCKVQQSYVCV